MSVWVTWPALTKLGTLGIFAGLITLAMEREALFENNLIDVENYDRHNADITCDPRSHVPRTAPVTSCPTHPKVPCTCASAVTSA